MIRRKATKRAHQLSTWVNRRRPQDTQERPVAVLMLTQMQTPGVEEALEEALRDERHWLLQSEDD